MGCVDCCGAHYTTALPPLPTSWERLLAQVAYTILCSYTFLYETKGNKWYICKIIRCKKIWGFVGIQISLVTCFSAKELKERAT